MIRIMEVFVILNAACGVATFVIAKGLVQRARRKLMGEDERREERS